MLRGKLLLLPYIFDSWRMAPGDVVAKVSWPKFNNRASESTATPERIDKKCFCLGIPSVIHAAGSTNTLGVATHNGELLFRADGFQRPLVRKKSSRRAASFLGSLNTKRLRRQTKEEKTKGQQPSRPIASALVFPPQVQVQIPGDPLLFLRPTAKEEFLISFSFLWLFHLRSAHNLLLLLPAANGTEWPQRRRIGSGNKGDRRDPRLFFSPCVHSISQF